MNQSKTAIQSKTLWFNILSIAAIVVAELSSSVEFKEAIGGHTGYLMIAGAAINVLIRFYTDKPIRIAKPKSKLNPVDEALRQDDIAIKEH